MILRLHSLYKSLNVLLHILFGPAVRDTVRGTGDQRGKRGFPKPQETPSISEYRRQGTKASKVQRAKCHMSDRNATGQQILRKKINTANTGNMTQYTVESYVCINGHVCVHMCVHACRSQRKTSNISLQAPLIFIY